MTPNLPGKYLVGVLSEARLKFGDPKGWNRPQVTAWVRQRVAEIRSEQGEPPDVRPFVGRGFEDGKAKAAGE